VFLDPLHLDQQGADALSAGLADVIAGARSNQDAGRWVNLVVPREFASDPPAESAGPSKLALQTPDEKAR
jgi:hypothetical protein